MPMFHVSSALNRASIAEHGLDWTRMGAAPGIAGSRQPEVSGCFLCRDEHERDWFAGFINNTGGPVDVWEVRGIDPADLVDNGSGLGYYPDTIPATALTLLTTDVPAPQRP